MSDVIFVRPRYNYEPYSDLHKLVQLSGYPLIFIDEMDAYDPTKCYLISPTNGEVGEGWPGARARLIHLQLEWEFEPPKSIPGVNEKWTSDAYHAQRIGARFVPMGSHRDLNLQPDANPDKVYDVAFLNAPAHRRYTIWGEVKDRGFSITPNGWGDERHAALLRSRCMVVVHQWEEFKCIAPLRWALAAAYKLPIISETVFNRAPFGHTHFMMSDFEHLARFVEMHLNDPHNWLGDYGLALYQKLCVEMTFRRSVESAL